MWCINPNMSYLTEDVMFPKPTDYNAASTKPVFALGNSEPKNSTKKLKLNTISNVYANLEKTDEEIKTLNQTLFKYINEMISTQKNIMNEPKNKTSSQLCFGESSGAAEERIDAPKVLSSCRYFRPFLEDNRSVCNNPPDGCDFENEYENFSTFLRSEGIDIGNPSVGSQNEELAFNEVLRNPPTFDGTSETSHFPIGANTIHSKYYDKHTKGMFDETFSATSASNFIDGNFTRYSSVIKTNEFIDSGGMIVEENVHSIEPPSLFRPYENLNASGLPTSCKDQTGSSVGFPIRYEFVKPEEIAEVFHTVKNRTHTQGQEVRRIFIEGDHDGISGYRPQEYQKESQTGSNQTDEYDDGDYEDETDRLDEIPVKYDMDKHSSEFLSSSVTSEHEKRVLVHQEQYYQDYHKMLRARSGSIDDVQLNRLPLTFNSNENTDGYKTFDTCEKELQKSNSISRSKRRIDAGDSDKDTICQNILKRYDQYKKNIVSELPNVQEDNVDNSQISSQIIKETQIKSFSCNSNPKICGDYKRNANDSSKTPTNVETLHENETTEIPDNRTTSADKEETKGSSNSQRRLTYGEYKRSVKNSNASNSNVEPCKDLKDVGQNKISCTDSEKSHTCVSTDNSRLLMKTNYKDNKRGIHTHCAGSYVKEKQARILPGESSCKEDNKVNHSARALINTDKNRYELKKVTDGNVPKSRGVAEFDRSSTNKILEHKKETSNNPKVESTYKTTIGREAVSVDRRKSYDGSHKWDPLKSRYGRRPGREDDLLSGEVSTNPFNPFCPDRGIEKEKPVTSSIVKERDPASTLTAIFEMRDRARFGSKAKRSSSNRASETSKAENKDSFKKCFKKLKVKVDCSKDVAISDPAVSSTSTLADFSCEDDVTSNTSEAPKSPKCNDSKDCEPITSSEAINNYNLNESIDNEKESVSKENLSSDIKDEFSDGVQSNEIHLLETSTNVTSLKSDLQTESQMDIQETVLAISSPNTCNVGSNLLNSDLQTESKMDIQETVLAISSPNTSNVGSNLLYSDSQTESQSDIQETVLAISSPNPNNVVSDLKESAKNRCEVISETGETENNIEDVSNKLAVVDCDNSDVNTTETQISVYRISELEEKLPENRTFSAKVAETAEKEQSSEISSPQISKNRICKLILVDIFWKAKRDGKFKKKRLDRLTRKFMKKYNSKLKKAQSILLRKTGTFNEMNDPGFTKTSQISVGDDLTKSQSLSMFESKIIEDNKIEPSKTSELSKESHVFQDRKIKETQLCRDSEDSSSKVADHSTSNEHKFDSVVPVVTTEVSCTKSVVRIQESVNKEPSVAVNPILNEEFDQGQDNYNDPLEKEIKNENGELSTKSAKEVIKNEQVISDYELKNKTNNTNLHQDFDVKKDDSELEDKLEKNTPDKLKLAQLDETNIQKADTSLKEDMDESKKIKNNEASNCENQIENLRKIENKEIRETSQDDLNDTKELSIDVLQRKLTDESDIKKDSKSLLDTVCSKKSAGKKRLKSSKNTSQVDDITKLKNSISQDLPENKSKRIKDEKCIVVCNENKPRKTLKETCQVTCDKTTLENSDISFKESTNKLKTCEKRERKTQTKKEIEERSAKTDESLSNPILDDSDQETTDTQTRTSDKSRKVENKQKINKESTCDIDLQQKNIKSKRQEKSKGTTQVKSSETSKKKFNISQNEPVYNSGRRKKYCRKDTRRISETVCYGENESNPQKYETFSDKDDLRNKNLARKLGITRELRVSLVDIKKYYKISNGSTKLTVENSEIKLESSGFRESSENCESDFDNAKCLMITSLNDPQERETAKSVAYNFVYNFSSDSNTEEAVTHEMTTEEARIPKSENTSCGLSIDDPTLNSSAPLPVIENVLSEINKSLLEIDKTPNTFIDESSNSSDEDFPFLKNLDCFLTNLSKLDTEDNSKKSSIPSGIFLGCRRENFEETNTVLDSHIYPSTSSEPSINDAGQPQDILPKVKTKAELKTMYDASREKSDTETKSKHKESKINIDTSVSVSSASSSTTETQKQIEDSFMCVNCRKQFSTSKSKKTGVYSKRISLFCQSCFLTVYKKRYLDFKKCKLNRKNKRYQKV